MSEYQVGDEVLILGAVIAIERVNLAISVAGSNYTIEELKDSIVEHRKILREGDTVRWLSGSYSLFGTVESVSKDGKFAFVQPTSGSDMLSIRVSNLMRIDD